MRIISRKYFISGIIIGIVLIFSVLFSLPDGKLHIVFCNVGQGDAAYIRTPNNQDMLIDGGPNNRVLDCLGRHMPFYDRRIDIVILSHPQKDHLQGLIEVARRFDIGTFIIGVEGNETEGYRQLVEVLKEKQIPLKNLFTGDSFRLGNLSFDILWPERKWVADNISNIKDQISKRDAGEAVLGLSTSQDLNSFSYFLHLKYGEFDALFTGDGDSKIQPVIMQTVQLPDIEVLKYPHHGSKTGILPAFLDKIAPELAVISVGKNSYGHPSNEALQLLKDRNITIERTDVDGDVEVVSDGKEWGE